MKNKGLIIFLIALLSVLVISISTAFILLLNGKLNFKNFHFSTNSKKEVISKKVYDESFSKIKIDSDVSDIVVKPSDSNEIRVIVKGNKEDSKVSYKITNNTLNITYKAKKCHFFCFNVNEGNIELYIPEDYNRTLVINNDVGDIEIDDFDYMSAKVDVDVGDIEIESIKNVDIDVDTGDVKIKNLKPTKNSKITTDVGDITVKHVNNVNIKASTDVGDKDINNNDKKSDITLKAETDVGDIKIN